MGPEAGLAIPAEDGGIDLIVSTQWLHNDRDQVAECLGLPPEKVRLSLGGVGGAFGAREDVSLQIHACLLAQRTGRPVKVVYSREESFLGHVHRHPARMWMRHSADTDGRLVSFEARILLDGGRLPVVELPRRRQRRLLQRRPLPGATTPWSRAIGVRTNNPPCGAMRGFGAVQVCFAHEAQMDKLAAACGHGPRRDPAAQRPRPGRPAPHRPGDRRGRCPSPGSSGSRGRSSAATAWPADRRPDGPSRRGRPHRRRAHVRRGVGLRGRVQEPDVRRGVHGRLRRPVPAERRPGHRDLRGGRGGTGLRDPGPADRPYRPRRRRRAAGAGRHLDRLGRIHLGQPPDLDVGRGGRAGLPGGRGQPAGRTSAPHHGVEPGEPRHRRRPHRRSAGRRPRDLPSPRPPRAWSSRTEASTTTGSPTRSTTTARATPTCRWCAPPTGPWSTSTPSSGLIRVVQIATAQDVGRALNPLQVLGQIEGGIAQGLGLATMEELIWATAGSAIRRSPTT